MLTELFAHDRYVRAGQKVIRELLWRPGLPAADARLADVLASWRGTPYASGQSTKGIGADCIRFVAAVLDELYGTGHAKRLPRVARDIGYHDPRGAAVAAREAIRRFPHVVLRGERVVEPGDVIAVGSHGGVQHVLIVGPKPRRLWHSATGRGVVEASFSEIGRNIKDPVRVWRMLGKDQW